ISRFTGMETTPSSLVDQTWHSGSGTSIVSRAMMNQCAAGPDGADDPACVPSRVSDDACCAFKNRPETRLDDVEHRLRIDTEHDRQHSERCERERLLQRQVLPGEAV